MIFNHGNVSKKFNDINYSFCFDKIAISREIRKSDT